MVNDIPRRTWTAKRIEDSFTPGRSVDLERYKLNVYSGGGFFKSHVDSPSGDEMIRPLVLCLPSPHEGGELCVSHDGSEHIPSYSGCKTPRIKAFPVISTPNPPPPPKKKELQYIKAAVYGMSKESVFPS